MLSEGRFQSIVWTRNSAESVLVTQLLKGIREMKPDIDLVALECLEEKSLPVPVTSTNKRLHSCNHWSTLFSKRSRAECCQLQHRLRRLGLKSCFEPRPSSRRLVSPSLPVSPLEMLSRPVPVVVQKKPGSSGALPVEGQRGKKRKAEPEDSSSQVRKLLTGRAINTLKNNRPKSVSTEHVEAWMQEFKQQYKGKFRELNKHVNFVVKLLTENAASMRWLKLPLNLVLIASLPPD